MSICTTSLRKMIASLLTPTSGLMEARLMKNSSKHHHDNNNDSIRLAPTEAKRNQRSFEYFSLLVTLFDNFSPQSVPIAFQVSSLSSIATYRRYRHTHTHTQYKLADIYSIGGLQFHREGARLDEKPVLPSRSNFAHSIKQTSAYQPSPSSSH